MITPPTKLRSGLALLGFIVITFCAPLLSVGSMPGEWYAALSLVGQNPGKPMKLVGDLRPVLKAGVGVMDDALEELATNMPTLPTLAKHSYVVFAPGAEYGPAKRWPAKHFAELAAKIDRPVFLLGSGKEFDICQEIATTANAAKPGHCFNLAGQTNLMQAFALIAYAHRVVSNDSGLMHVAAALGVPQVALFSNGTLALLTALQAQPLLIPATFAACTCSTTAIPTPV